ncbi:MAG: hypothetical protein NVV73_11190 [Cellvibrionaceae bacterium]|nr:hypothetical protein [Cellvibrionaceae bacterium]
MAPASRSFFHQKSIIRRRPSFQQNRSAGGGHIGGIEIVFEQHRNAVQRRARPFAFALRIKRTCLLQGFAVEGDDRIDLRPLLVKCLYAFQIHLYQLFRTEGACFKRGVEVCNGGGIQGNRRRRRHHTQCIA